MLNIVILASGNGSNFQVIADRADEIGVRIKALIVNKKEAFVLERAKKANVPAILIEHKNFPDRESFCQALDKAISQQGTVDYIILAGFMRVLSPSFVGKYAYRIINLHPSLLPKYKGLNTHARALADKAAYHGISIHFVSEVLDDGPIIFQEKVKIEPEDDLASLTAKVQAQEHKYYPLVIKWLAQRHIRLQDNQVYFDKPLSAEGIACD